MADSGSKNKTFFPPVRGRGTLDNPDGRFESTKHIYDAENYENLCQISEEMEDGSQIRTEVLPDTSRSIVTDVDSPDVGIESTINPYRGCEHGCIYCYARPSHEYLGMSAGLDFETKIFVKEKAPELLVQKLQSKSWKPKVLTLSGITDPYQPVERKLEITRKCFEVLRDFKNPALVITKNHLVTRDIDIFQEMAVYQTIGINLSITTLDAELCRHMEPRTSHPLKKLKAVEELAKVGIPVGIMMGPILPGLTDHEIPAILKSAADAGAQNANYTMLRLPYGVKDLFHDWVYEHYPNRAGKILNRMREMYEGKLYNAEFGTRMRGRGIFAQQIANMFSLYKKKYNLNRPFKLSTSGFDKTARDAQLSLF